MNTQDYTLKKEGTKMSMFSGLPYSWHRNFCFGGGGKQPALPPPPAIAPSPVPTETKSGGTLEGRQKAISMLKFGALSTITNAGGASGISGVGPDVYPSMGGGKTTTGS